jgi:hypothetical protein
MYLVLFLDQHNYEFITTLHSTREAAEAAYEALMKRFNVDVETMSDKHGEGPHIYKIECDGKPAEEIGSEDLAAA